MPPNFRHLGLVCRINSLRITEERMYHSRDPELYLRRELQSAGFILELPIHHWFNRKNMTIIYEQILYAYDHDLIERRREPISYRPMFMPTNKLPETSIKPKPIDIKVKKEIMAPFQKVQTKELVIKEEKDE